MRILGSTPRFPCCKEPWKRAEAIQPAMNGTLETDSNRKVGLKCKMARGFVVLTYAPLTLEFGCGEFGVRTL